MEYAELILVVQNGSTIWARRQDGAEVSGVFVLDDLHSSMIEIFEDWLNTGKIARRRELEVLGSLLYRTLFNDRIEIFFKQSLDEVRKTRQRLRVQLSFEGKAADLANLPWEYLYSPDTETSAGFFLATHVNLVLSHYMPLEQSRQALAPAESPLRILIVVSKPQDPDLGPVSADLVIETIQNLAEKYPIKLDILQKPTIENLLEILEDTKPHVLHFIGHGRFDKLQERGQIALLDINGKNALWINDREFTEFFVQNYAIPRLAFLHLCESGAIDFTANFAGLTPQLIRAGVQAVVAMKYPITNRAATIFSRAFYSELAKGEPVDNAVQIGRWQITINDPLAYDSPVFGVPVLYMRSRDGIIQPPPTLKQEEVSSE